MRVRRSLLVQVLLHPATARTLGLADWDLLVRQARSAQLLARLAVTLIEAGFIDEVPDAPRRHLNGALELQARQRQAVRWEVEHLLDALTRRNLRLVLLKGAAYELAGLPPARCRLFADLDILVPRDRLQQAELALLAYGWTSAYHDPYDDRYYRTWMHELPPMRHLKRNSVIDVHHNLIPDTGPLHPNAAKLLDAAVACPDRSDVFVLAPQDMILHSAVHLFHDGEFDHALRDLFDIRELVAQWLSTPEDWNALARRAFELDLAPPLFHAVRYLEAILDVDVPVHMKHALAQLAPASLTQRVLDGMFERGLRPDHESCRDAMSTAARWMLYVRGHALRMPLRLLLPHLVRKSMMRLRSDPIKRPRRGPIARNL